MRPTRDVPLLLVLSSGASGPSTESAAFEARPRPADAVIAAEEDKHLIG